MKKITLFWMRRDLRLEDNTGLFYACQNEENVLPLFIFDTEILDELENKKDARVEFIHSQLQKIQDQLTQHGSSLLIKTGTPLETFKELVKEYDIAAVYTNRDYEPYSRLRDKNIDQFLQKQNIDFMDFKDQVIFEKEEILNEKGTFYKVFTPYKNAWLKKFKKTPPSLLQPNLQQLYPTHPLDFPSLSDIGFAPSAIQIPPLDINQSSIKTYDKTRDFPALDSTSHLGIHLRFGTISVRKLVLTAAKLNDTYLSELIWREFFMMILYHNPHVVTESFKQAYDKVPWRNDKEEFKKWCAGKTGYPLVDAGMRELNTTGYMHNRVRMVTASFLTKHLLIDWRWGEAYFAEKLLDYELAANNGNWQWAAGTGTDAQPYFRIFNPASQVEKFDKDLKYIKKWVKEYGSDQYPSPIVEHKMARERALKTYKSALDK
ncbi:deoxyribodipyrimidine photo-lyase [Echinicola strongylocentroti]|uniref:Deoxyribodipyrimidine photo-lyase n=1 Tax=Echinicola strongylocentroti TaxID=1795355 RepID=A0A2Z4ILR9_9BACT|nr:deoxyribodipyrimidine photo-lyase [Echinicola strongylocentroti]AWW31518.1 deoxyribodipyrimidine photo-lyase [Echinicola strongylocentroti]